MDRTGIRTVLIFFASGLFFLLFAGQLPVTDPVEANYALTAKEMLQAGDWLSPRIYGQFWFDKPIMIYWLLVVFYALLGVTELASRLPSILFSAASVAFCYWSGVQLYRSARVGTLAAMLLATSLQFWLLSRMIITDAVLFFFTALTLVFAYLGLRDNRPSWLLWAYAAAGLAVLTKGPVGLVLPGIILLVFVMKTKGLAGIKALQLPVGLLVFLLVAAPWHLLMVKLHGDLFVNMFLGLHNYVRATVSEHPKDNVVYYYLVLFPVSLLPWTGLAAAGLWRGWRQGDSADRFLVWWTAAFFLFYTAMATKYPTYVFPTLFPAILLGAAYLEKQDKISRWLLAAPALLLFGALTIASAVMPAYGTKVFTAVAGTGFCLCAAAAVRMREAENLVKLIGGVAVVVALLLVQQVLMPLAATRSAKAIVTNLPAHAAAIGSAGDYSTSAVFYTGRIMPRLVELGDGMADSSRDGVWAQKHTMPKLAWQEFEQQSDTVWVLVKTNEAKNWQKSLADKGYQLQQRSGSYLLFERQ